MIDTSAHWGIFYTATFRMDRLLAYLNETGWFNPHEYPGFPAQRICDKEEWCYQWLVQSKSLALLFRHRPLGAGRAYEAFTAQEETRCLYWARKMNQGIYPPSPEPDSTGRKVGVL